MLAFETESSYCFSTIGSNKQISFLEKEGKMLKKNSSDSQVPVLTVVVKNLIKKIYKA